MTGRESSPLVQRVRAEQRAQLRAQLLDLARELLTQEGAEALTMRRLAERAGTSTTVLYNAFGGKQGLGDALFLEGFDRLRERLDQVPAGSEPAGRTGLLLEAYRAFALEQPTSYRIMFGQSLPGFVPGPDAKAYGRRVFGVLVDAVREAMRYGELADDDPVAVAEALWAVVHGAVELELAGMYPDEGVAPDRARRAVRAALRGLRRD